MFQKTLNGKILSLNVKIDASRLKNASAAVVKRGLKFEPAKVPKPCLCYEKTAAPNFKKKGFLATIQNFFAYQALQYYPLHLAQDSTLQPIFHHIHNVNLCRMQ